MRKGARSIKQIPDDILADLNFGKIPSANLVEWLAIDQLQLLKNVLETAERASYFNVLKNRVEALPKKSILTVNQEIGAGLFAVISEQNDDFLWNFLSNHSSDAVRCWMAYALASDSSLRINELLEAIKVFACDEHFGVREVAWLAIRPRVSANLIEALPILEVFAKSEDEALRRFSSELIRPRGVWCSHIEVLKNNPEPALPILEALRSDSSKYVRDSVGNWLNDASKSSPKFVHEICQKWLKESHSSETKYIVKKALRTLVKSAKKE